MTEQNKTIERSAAQEFWKEATLSKMPSDWAENIDNFETEVYLKKQGKIEDKVFAETRLRLGAYGQRYDNGKRHNGKEAIKIAFPAKGITKGSDTEWDAPGMLRIKIPYGGLNFDQMYCIADLAEEYSDSICHVTTRQDIQLHFIHIEDTPSIFRRLAAVGITTQEACGNSVRNITASFNAGLSNDEVFDVTPYADAMFRFLLGHPDVQDFGRKMKISFSGHKVKPTAIAAIHDVGYIATTREIDGKTVRGFEFYVGGGLGAVPFKAKLLKDFVTEEELFPLTQAVCRIFARHGEKQKRARARIKFLVNDWGIEKFREEVFAERAKLKNDIRWTDYIPEVAHKIEKAKKSAQIISQDLNDKAFATWYKKNVEPQKQAGYNMVSIVLPLGDITANQFRDLAELSEKYIDGTLRVTIEQNIVLRWVIDQDLKALYQDLKKIGLTEMHAESIQDITACPGTDTCKLGTSASRGLAGELMERLSEKKDLDEAVANLSIKISGCYNSCAQHHIADIGFYGITRKANGRIVPHFQCVLGGKAAEDDTCVYGLAIGGFPSKAIPAVLERLTDMYIKEKQTTERFGDYVTRTGKVEIKKRLLDLMDVPSFESDPSYYTDWGDTRVFTTSDIGVGECAGEIVSLVDFGLKAADRQVFEAQIALDEGKEKEALQIAIQAMLEAARALLKDKNPDISEDANIIRKEFKEKFCDSKIFHHPFAGDKFANYFFNALDQKDVAKTSEQIRQGIEEAQLFIEEAYNCNVRMSMNS